ncbi:30S ribosome-binding factor RbfA [Piscinibacterium candidicorallinum]|uniref:Ribosome-binding factor A n=1 Tax=Piscinibacterium candidicorallinum TaxID=1793872 RepID=A0ABV7H5V4_9BURK
MRNKPKTGGRPLRVGDQIQRDLAELLQFEVKDPRIGLITLTGVEVSPDYSHAKVYFTTLAEDAKIDEVIAGLNAARGYLRRELGRRISIFQTPELHFIHDQSIARGAHLSELIDQAVKDKAQD